MCAVGVVLVVGCSTANTNAKEELDYIVNGDTLATATTYWQSTHGCLISNGGQGCTVGPFNFKLAADHTVEWTQDDQNGVTTWTKLAADSIAISGLPYPNEPSLNMSHFQAGTDHGVCYAAIAGYPSVEFKLEVGTLPGHCNCPSGATGYVCSAGKCSGGPSDAGSD